VDEVIVADKVTMRFNLVSENINNLKEYVLKMLKGQLMFQEFFALRDVSFKIKKGEAWGLIGVNGSGKSTLLKVICGVLNPYSGKMTVRGSIAPLIELGAGIDGELTARENIFLNGAILGYNKKVMQEHFNEIVDFAELGQFLDTPVKNFSSGMAARLGFSIATVVKPDILIVDEVLAVGDYAFQQKCMQRMNEMLDEGTTLLYVSHSVESVQELCSKVLWLDHGKTVMQGEAHEVCAAYVASQQKKI